MGCATAHSRKVLMGENMNGKIDIKKKNLFSALSKL
jgi:hypothetical protein